MAPGTAATEYATFAIPHTADPWPLMGPGLEGVPYTVRLQGVHEGLCPQAFDAATVITPEVIVPTDAVIEGVPCPLRRVNSGGRVQT